MNDERRGLLRETVGMPPEMARAETQGVMPGTAETQQIFHGPGGRASRSGKLNLRAVADVLESYGLDPIEEIARVMVEREPVLDDRGQPVIGADGKPLTKPVLDKQTFLKTAIELAQYSRPKLKAIEVTTKQDMTPEEIDKRLERLMRRQAEGKA